MKRMILSMMVLASVAMAASDSAKYLGSTGEGRYPQVDSVGKVLWTKTLGCGYSNVAIVGDKLYTAGFAGGKDVIYCLDAKTGKESWTYSYPAEPGKFKGPRATPTVVDGKIYFVSRAGETFCLDAAKGTKLWSVTAKKVRCEEPRWGMASSPLIDKGLCIVNLGRIVAFDAATGKTKWMTRTDYKSGYSTPRMMTVGGKEFVVAFPGEGVVTLDPKTGKVLDVFRWHTFRGLLNIAIPIFVGPDQLFISSAYQTGCAMLKLSADGKIKQLWSNKDMCNHFSSSMLFAKEGYLVGIHGNTSAKNPLVAMDVKTGKVLWEKKDVGAGGLIHCGTNLLVIGYGGKVELLTTTREGYKVLQTVQVFDCTPCWTSPAIADGRVYFRSNSKGATKSTLTCYEVK